MRNRRTRIIAVLAVLAIIAGLGIYGLTRSQNGNVSQTAVTGESSSGLPETPATPDGSIPEDCPSDPQPIAAPATFEMVNQGTELPMMSVGMDPTGAAAGAPPGDESHTVAWWNGGPLVGSDTGKAVLTSHTYQFGGALGNELNDGLWTIGDIIKITGEDGSVACYRYSGNTHIMVEDYDPDSTIVYDFGGTPQFALVVCSDYTPSGEALGRMVYYGALITGDGAGGMQAGSDQHGAGAGPAGAEQPAATGAATTG